MRLWGGWSFRRALPFAETTPSAITSPCESLACSTPALPIGALLQVFSFKRMPISAISLRCMQSRRSNSTQDVDLMSDSFEVRLPDAVAYTAEMIQFATIGDGAIGIAVRQDERTVEPKLSVSISCECGSPKPAGAESRSMDRNGTSLVNLGPKALRDGKRQACKGVFGMLIRHLEPPIPGVMRTEGLTSRPLSILAGDLA